MHHLIITILIAQALVLRLADYFPILFFYPAVFLLACEMIVLVLFILNWKRLQVEIQAVVAFACFSLVVSVFWGV